MIIYSGCKSTKKILFTLRFLVFFLRQLASQIFILPKPLGIFAQLCGASLPKVLGTVTQDFGHPYPCTWVWKPVYVGMSIHGRGQNCSASARCLLGRGNRWH